MPARAGDYDLIVIGGGAAGLGTARAAARAGARALLVSDAQPGGECTFTGCVPSKTLIEAAKQGIGFLTAAQRIRDVVARIAAAEDAAALRRERIDVTLGRAQFTGPHRLQVDGRALTARRFVIATGSAPLIPPIPGLNNVPHLTNETIFDLPALPASLAILGGGAVGCELAQAFARLGSHVTIIEGANRLLPREDPEASQVIATVFGRDGIGVHTGTQATGVAVTAGGIRVSLANGNTVTAERLLVAVGRRPVTDGLNVEHTGVRLDERGHAVTDDHLATSAPGIYAAGDVTGRLLFTHAAFHMGRIAAGNALARHLWQRRRYQSDTTPRVTFTDPEVAHVGMAEAEAARHGAWVAYLPMDEMDRALTAQHTDGFIKLIAGPRPVLRKAGGGRILGAAIVATRAGELIHEPTLAIATHMFTGRLAATTHAYPTWSYGLQLAAAQFFMTTGGRTARAARPHP